MNNNPNFVTETVNDTFILTIKLKRATIEEASELNKALSGAIGNGWKKLLVEMDEVGALVINLKKIMEIEGKFGLIGFKASLQTIIQQISLDRTFQIYKSREEALENI